MTFGLFNCYNYFRPSLRILPYNTVNWYAGFNNFSSVFSRPQTNFLTMPSYNSGYNNFSIFTQPLQTLTIPMAPKLSVNSFNILPRFTNVWNSFKSNIGSGYNQVKRGITTVTNKVTDFVKGIARHQAQYSAISDKVKTYGRNSKFLEKLHPEMQEKMMQLLDWAKSKGITLNITSGFRTTSQQRGLQYKNKGGKKVAAAPGTSPHEYGIAVDFKSSNNTAVGQKAKELGMRWGGDWGGRGWSRETWHIDMANTLKKVRA